MSCGTKNDHDRENSTFIFQMIWVLTHKFQSNSVARILSNATVFADIGATTLLALWQIRELEVNLQGVWWFPSLRTRSNEVNLQGLRWLPGSASMVARGVSFYCLVSNLRTPPYRKSSGKLQTDSEKSKIWRKRYCCYEFFFKLGLQRGCWKYSKQASLLTILSCWGLSYQLIHDWRRLGTVRWTEIRPW